MARFLSNGPGNRSVNIVNKFIVDTSVWIDFFRGSLGPVVRENLIEGIRLNLAVMTDIIRHEIRVGARDKRSFQDLSRILSPLDCLRIADGELHEFDHFAWGLYQKGIPGKYTDASIAFLAHKNKVPILSFDRYFHLLARKGLIQVITYS